MRGMDMNGAPIKIGASIYKKTHNMQITGVITGKLGDDNCYVWVCDANIVRTDDMSDSVLNTKLFGICDQDEHTYIIKNNDYDNYEI